MSPSSRARLIVLVPLLAAPTQACIATRRVPDLSISPGTRVRVVSGSPFALTRQMDTLAPATSCCVTSVDGRFVRAAGDTIVLERGSYSEILADGNRVPSRPEMVKVTVTPGMEVMTRETDHARTTALLVVVLLGVVGLAALGASQIEYELP